MNLNSNLFWCVIGIIGGAIISFIISLIFYFVGLKRKSLLIEINTNTMISDDIPQFDNLSITYDNHPIDNLYSSTIKIQNVGNTTIESDDFVKNIPLSITTIGYFILNKDKKIAQISNGEIYDFNCILDNTMTHPTENKSIILFDCIPKKKTIVLTLFHTGPIKFKGKLKDGKIVCKHSFYYKSKYFTDKQTL